MSKMPEAALVNLLLGLAVSGIQDVQLGPKKTAHTPNAVSPSQAATVFQFGRGHSVGPGFFDFASYLGQSFRGDAGRSPFRLQKTEKGFGRLRERWWALPTG
jgi:hypothetical protein